MPVQLLIMGASVRGAAQAAIRAGLRVIGADLFCDSDLAALGPPWKIKHYPSEFLKVIDGLHGIPWMYTGGLENFPSLIDRMAQHGPLWGNGGDVLRAVRDAKTLQRIVSQISCPQECTLHFPTTHSLMEMQQPPAGETKWIYKPRRGSGGLAVRHAEQLSPAKRGGYWQELMLGVPHSASFLSAAGECQLLGVTRQFCAQDFPKENGPIAATHPFAYAGNLGACEISAPAHEMLTLLGKELTKQTGLSGLWGADLIVQKNRWSLIEVNPRYTASMEVLEEGLGIPLLLWHRAAFEKKTLPAMLNKSLTRRQSITAKAIVYARHEVNVTPKFLTKLAATFPSMRSGLEVYDWPSIADIPVVQQKICEGQPICTVFVRNNSAKLAESQLRRAIKDVQRLAKQHSPRTSADDGELSDA